MAIRAVALDLGHTLMDERLDILVTPSVHDESHLMTGAREALDRLTLPVAIWANTRIAREGDVRRWLERARLSGHVRWVITSVDAGARKPARAFFEHALRVMQMHTADVLFVGNQRNTDIAGGAAAGIATVLLTDPSYRSNDDAHVPCEPTFTIATLHDLSPLVATLAEPRTPHLNTDRYARNATG